MEILHGEILLQPGPDEDGPEVCLMLLTTEEQG